jgi:EAL domain-containing protein (putative c-di-GMP-specific phosphodiesterase class I)
MHFAATHRQVQITIRLPLLALEDMQFVDRMMEHLPNRIRQDGFLVAIDCADLVHDYTYVRRIGGQLASRNIGIAIDDVDAQGALLAGKRDLPVVEMKIDRKLTRGCADDRSKQAHCAEIVTLAREAGARSVADGVETQSDYLAVRDLGFDLLKGHMFAKPMAPRKFERAILARRHAAVA